MLSALCLGVSMLQPMPPQTIKFSGFTWTIRQPGKSGPGPNEWSPKNVWVDRKGYLHLRLAEKGGQWECAEVYTEKRYGFGTYRWEVQGRIDTLDPSIVLGLFNYPTKDVGPDATNEIDIEFARWGDPAAANGNYTVWPAKEGIRHTTTPFPVTLKHGDVSTHEFVWTPQAVKFTSEDALKNPLGSWTFSPTDAEDRIGQKPMPIQMNLWLFQGQPPTDGKPVELIIRSFKFTPLTR